MAASSSPSGGGPRSAPKSRKPRQRTPSDAQVWRQLDDRQHEAYQAGRRGEPAPPPDAPESVHQAHRLGLEDRGSEEGEQAMDRMRSQAKAATAPKGATRVRGQAPLSVSMQDQGAPFILGLVAYCLVINYVRYGWPGVTGWLSAKFTNQVTIDSSGAHTGIPGTPPGSFNLPPTNTPNPNPGIGSNLPIATAPSGQPIYGYIQP